MTSFGLSRIALKTASRRLFSLASAFALIALTFAVPQAQATDKGYPKRVLITNDNGIEDPKIVALARAFAEVSEVWLVASVGDYSGTTNALTITRTGSVGVEQRDLGEGIRAYAVDGTPGDCVVVALGGLMGDAMPDLIISGINGGSNEGADWMFSGTIGAARVAAFAGFPAIAVSGLDDDLPGAVDAANRWVLELVRSQVVAQLQPGDYLTVSLPRVGPSAVRGVRFADRSALRRGPQLALSEADDSWQVRGLRQVETPPASGTDEFWLARNYIVVVPMQVDEVDHAVLGRWRTFGPDLPSWQP